MPILGLETSTKLKARELLLQTLLYNTEYTSETMLVASSVR